jgi:hypothetical protein
VNLRGRTSLCYLLTISLFCYSYWVSAQDIQTELSQKINELRDRVKPESDLEAQRRESQASKQLEDLEKSAEPIALASPRDPRFEILSHHRGSQGIAFPNPRDVVLEMPASTAPNNASQPLREYWVTAPGARQRPTRCTKSDTIAIPRRNKGASDEVLADRLYVWNELVPVDHMEVYGANTIVEAYDGDQAQAVLVGLEADAVPCVPYRIRYTSTHIYRHAGQDALANFESPHCCQDRADLA